MPFRFTLEAVLTYRKNLEQREYLALGKAQQEVAAVEAQIQDFELSIAEVCNRRAEEAKQGIASVHLQESYGRERMLQRRCDELQIKLEELKIRRQQCLKAYDLARQKKEILQELRGRQLHAYAAEQARRQQQLLDDLFLARRKRHS